MGRVRFIGKPGHRVLLSLVFLACLTGLLWMISPSFAERMLFFPSREDPGSPPVLRGVGGVDVVLTGQDGTLIHGWWYPAPADSARPAPRVLLLHGNAGHIGHRAGWVDGFLSQGVGVLLLEYRGYGRNEGKPSEEGLAQDARAGLAFLSEMEGGPSRVVVMGRSMGGAVAARLAATVPVGGLILESAFTSLEDMAGSVYPFLPGILFRRLRGMYSTVDAVRVFRGPVMVVHGTEDELVPLRMGLALHEAAPGESEWFGVKGAHHNDVLAVGGTEYIQRLADFCHRVVSGG